MLRVLLFALLVLALGAGFAWLADRPGDIVLTFGDMRYETTLMVAATALVALTATVMLVWWVIKGIWNSPMTVRRYFRARKRDRGYQSLSSGLLAAGAGDTLAARRLVKQASGLLSSDQEPLVKLLDVQTTLLEGDHAGARGKLEDMLGDPETQLLALRGLYLEAGRVGEPDAARQYAEKAFELNPALGWAGDAALQAKAIGNDWDGALALLDRQRAPRGAAKDGSARKRAVLLTAKAMDLADRDATAARNLANDALRLAPDLVPATVTAAEAMYRLGDLRRAATMLEKAWKAEPHPDIARTYVNARMGDSTHDRLKRARRLLSLKPGNADALMAVATAALAAGEFKAAREALEAVTKSSPRASAWLLLADVEEAETGDQGRVRAFLGQALRAPRDPAWTADGYVSQRWLPVSPVTGAIDAFVWKVPVEQIAQTIDASEPAPVPIMPPEKPAPEAEIAPPAAPAETVQPRDGVEDAIVVETAAIPAMPNGADGGPAVANGETQGEPLVPVADDPGIDPQAAPPKRKRFRLF